MLLNNGKFSDATEIAVELSNVSKQVLPGLPTLVRIIVTNPTKEDITILPLDAHDFGRWCWTWENEKGEVLRELKYGDFLLAIPSLPVGTDPKVMLGAGKSREWMILVPVPEEVEQEKQVRLTVELIEDTEFHGKASVKELYTVGKPCQIKGGGKDLHREAQLIIRNGDGYSAKYMMVEGKGAADFRDAAFRGNDYLTLIWFLALLNDRDNAQFEADMWNRLQKAAPEYRVVRDYQFYLSAQYALSAAKSGKFTLTAAEKKLIEKDVNGVYDF